MRIVYAIPVEHLAVLADGRLMASGIETNGKTFPSLPGIAVVPLVIAVAEQHVAAQATVSHPLKIRVLGPDLAEVGQPMDLSITLAPGPQTPAGWEVRAIVPAGVQFEVEEAGTYSVEISADGAPLSVPIIVRTT